MEERIFARKGTEDDLVERLTEYIRHFDEDWENKIEGATDKEIQQLEDVFKLIDKNFNLPKDLYIYLKYMGRNNENLCEPSELISSYYFNIEFMIKANEEYVQNLYLGENKNISHIILAQGYLGCNTIMMDLKTGNILDVVREDYCGFEPNNILKAIIENKDDENFKKAVKKVCLQSYYKYWKEELKNDKDLIDDLIKNNFEAPLKEDVRFLEDNLEKFLFKLAYNVYES